ncbi:U1 small nuclear ribonucleoprotein [Glycine max]|nr:U1 small nuclear ribonucleoprotein [Glycine max]
MLFIGLIAGMLRFFAMGEDFNNNDPLIRNQNAAVQARAKDQNRANALQLKLAQKRARIHKLRLEKGAAKAAEELEKYDPHNDPNVSGDPYKTLFIARLSYESTDSRMKREFESYGAIKRVGVLNIPKGFSKDILFSTLFHPAVLCGKRSWGMGFDWLLTLTNKPKGYAFIEYFHTRDEKADGRKIEGQRGGGLGTTRVGGEEVNQQHFGREQQQSGLSRSEEPRAQEDHHGDRDREKSRERGKDRHRESEWSCERSSGRARDRDYRGDRHYRDWDRNMDRDRERERDRDVIVVESVIRIGIMTRTANMTVIVKEIGIMKLG